MPPVPEEIGGREGGVSIVWELQDREPPPDSKHHPSSARGVGGGALDCLLPRKKGILLQLETGLSEGREESRCPGSHPLHSWRPF